MSRDTYTRLTACRAAGRIDVRLRFGGPARTRRLRGGVTHYWFTAGQVFGVMWWARQSPRKQFACFAIVEALDIGQSGHRLPCIHPAVCVHLFVSTRCVGNDRRVVDRAESLVQAIENAGIDPCRVASACFHAAGQSLRVRREPRRLHAASPSLSNRSRSHEA